MQYIRELAEYNGNGRAAVTFGKFDGLHRGHQMLVTKVRELGKQENINSIVCSFDMRPLWKEKGIAPELLMVGEERQERVKDEVDYLIDDYSSLSAVPLEVKSGKDYTVHSALNTFVQNEDYHIKKAFVLSNERNVSSKGKITYLPIYYVMFFSAASG